jgi:hypothetical protein
MAKVNPDPSVPKLGGKAWLQVQHPRAAISVRAQPISARYQPTFDQRTAMGQPSAVILLLPATLLAGCATHYRADRRPAADDRLGAVAANVLVRSRSRPNLWGQCAAGGRGHDPDARTEL